MGLAGMRSESAEPAVIPSLCFFLSIHCTVDEGANELMPSLHAYAPPASQDLATVRTAISRCQSRQAERFGEIQRISPEEN